MDLSVDCISVDRGKKAEIRTGTGVLDTTQVLWMWVKEAGSGHQGHQESLRVHNQTGRAGCSPRKVEKPGLDCSVGRAEEAS